MSNYMPEPPPLDYDQYEPPPDEAYFMPDDPFPDELFMGTPPDYDYAALDGHPALRFA